MHVGELLREWRHRRRLSQLDLGLRAGVSARHISFVETGRSTPSSDMVLHLADHLDIPPHDRNQLLVAAGHAPVYRSRPFDHPDLAKARDVLRQVLRAHEPFPALVVDRHWNLVLANDAVDVFFDGVAPELLRPPVNMMRLGLHPDGFAPRLRNLEQVRAFLLPRLARQAARTGDAELTTLHDELRSHAATETTATDPADVALTIRLRYRDTDLTFHNMITTFGAAFDLTLTDLVIESYLPADPATTDFLTRTPVNLRSTP